MPNTRDSRATKIAATTRLDRAVACGQPHTMREQTDPEKHTGTDEDRVRTDGGLNLASDRVDDGESFAWRDYWKPRTDNNMEATV